MRQVYVMRAEVGPVKIGVSRDAVTRAGQVTKESGRRVSVEHATPVRPDALAVEALAHSLLKHKRTSGEWFDVTVEEAIAAIDAAIAALDGNPVNSDLMQPSEFWEILRMLGLTQSEFGVLVNSPLRTVSYWATVSVPSHVAALAWLLERRPELVEVMREISATERAKE